MNSADQKIPLTAFEHLMWADDRDETPMTFYLQLSFDGEINRKYFVESVRIAITRHPLLQCLVVGKPTWTTRRLFWEPVREYVAPYIDQKQGTEEFQPPNGQLGINIANEIGVRFFIRVHEKKSVLLAQFHHAVVDAIGASSFLEDVLGSYHAISESLDPELLMRPINPELLKNRGDFHLSKSEYRKRRGIDWRKIRQHFFSHPEMLSSSDIAAKHTTPNACTSKSFMISDFDLDELKSYAKINTASINDVLLRDLFIVVKQWNSSRLKRQKTKPIRIAMPIDMRLDCDKQMPAANVVSLYTIDRTTNSINDPEALLKGIRSETTYIKKNRLGFALIRMIRILSKLPAGLCILMCPSRLYPCHTTTILSNLGIVLKDSLLPRGEDSKIQIGQLTLNSWGLIPPYRPKSPLAIGVSTVGNCLQVNLHYNPNQFSEDEAEEFRELFKKQIYSNWFAPKASGSQSSQDEVVNC
ncbi:MAG: hypothetical protein JKY95_12845 [Planctomycetaceae bacterium]|nr:hypothetical protein [Planctomycetaceae bacterium]